MSQLYLIFHHPSSWLDFYIFSIMTFTWQVVLNLEAEHLCPRSPRWGHFWGCPGGLFHCICIPASLMLCVHRRWLFENPPKLPHQAFYSQYFIVQTCGYTKVASWACNSTREWSLGSIKTFVPMSHPACMLYVLCIYFSGAKNWTQGHLHASKSNVIELQPQLCLDVL